jgi:uncharacterized protein YjlB
VLFRSPYHPLNLAKPILLSLCLLVLFTTGSLATTQSRSRRLSHQQQQNRCQIDQLEALEPSQRIRSEAGLIERWDANEEQLQCAGVAVSRYTIERNGLFLPSFNNAPQLVYILEGNGIQGTVFPGCPETFQSVQGQSEQQLQGRRQQEQSPRFQDQHQKIRRIKEGDVIALPAGVAHWTYNEGNDRLVAIVFHDVNNQENQLDWNSRRFFLAGNPQEENEQRHPRREQPGKFVPFRPRREQEQEREMFVPRREQEQEQEREMSLPRRQQEQERRRHPIRRHSQQGQEECNNIFCAFDVQILAEAFNVDEKLVQNLQNSDDQRGPIVRVEGELQVIRPPREQEEREEQQERQREQQSRRERPHGRHGNGLEETLCSLRIKQNIRQPSLADVFTPQGGRITSLNSLNLPILNFLKLSFEEGVLYRNSMMAPHWHQNAHNVMYAKRGRARIQVVDNNGNNVFDDEVSEGQLLTIPQNFAVVKRTEQNEGFEWVGFKTNDRAQINTLVGKTSVMRALPIDVIANSFQISREDAWRLKNARKETTVFNTESSAERRADA